VSCDLTSSLFSHGVMELRTSNWYIHTFVTHVHVPVAFEPRGPVRMHVSSPLLLYGVVQHSSCIHICIVVSA
jgi:hypothetical protein